MIAFNNKIYVTCSPCTTLNDYCMSQTHHLCLSLKQAVVVKLPGYDQLYMHDGSWCNTISNYTKTVCNRRNSTTCVINKNISNNQRILVMILNSCNKDAVYGKLGNYITILFTLPGSKK